MSDFFCALGCVLEILVNGERSDDSFCAVLHQHSFCSTMLSSHRISAPPTNGFFFCLKCCLSRVFVVVIFRVLNMSLESNAHFHLALTASYQHIVTWGPRLPQRSTYHFRDLQSRWKVYIHVKRNLLQLFLKISTNLLCLDLICSNRNIWLSVL